MVKFAKFLLHQKNKNVPVHTFMSIFFCLVCKGQQNEFMRSFFLKCKPKIARISALPNKQGS